MEIDNVKIIHDAKTGVLRVDGVPIGLVSTSEDGYYWYWGQVNGCYDSFQLRVIAKYLDIINKTWDNKVKSDLSKYKDEDLTDFDPFK